MEYISRRNRKTDIHRESDHWNEVHQDIRRVQRKSLEVSAPNDADEKEADTIARKVVNNQSVSPIEKSNQLNRSGQGTSEVTPQFESKLQNTKGGQGLNDSMRGEMESKLNADLSQVKLHTGSESQAMSESINAKAFTYGQDIHFNVNQYNPASSSGKELLAHELVHTVQQGSGKVRPKIQRLPGDEKRSMEQLLETSIINTIRREDPPSIAHLEEFFNSEVGRRILLDFNIKAMPDEPNRTIKLGARAIGTSDNYSKYLPGGTLGNNKMPTNKRGWKHLIMSSPGSRANKKKLVRQFEAEWESNELKRQEDANNKFITWNKHQCAAVSFSIAMLEQRADYLNDARFRNYIEAEAGSKNGKTTWLIAGKLKADYTSNKISDVLLFEMVSKNPDMPINAKANLLAFVTGSQEFQYGDTTTNPGDPNTTHSDPYSVGSEYEKNLAYDTLIGHPDFILAKERLLTPDVKDVMRTELEAKAQEVFSVLMPDEGEMPHQYLAAVGEGGTTTALGGEVKVEEQELSDPDRYDPSRKSRVGAGYFMYEEPDDRHDMSGKQNSVYIEFPINADDSLEIYMYPYGFDTLVKPMQERDPMHAQELETWSQIRVTVTLQLNGADVSATIYFDSANRMGTVALYDQANDQAQPVDISTIFPGATYLNNVLTLPNKEEYKGKTIHCLIDKPNQPPKRAEELQMHISSDVPISDFITREYEGEFPEPQVANAMSLFATAHFLIKRSELEKEENKEMRENIEELGKSITDKDFNSFLSPGEHSIDTIFSVTAGGVNPMVKKNQKEGMTDDKIASLPSLSDAEIEKLENVKGERNLEIELNKIIKGDDVSYEEMKKWRTVSGEKQFEGGTPKSKKYKYKNQKELDEVIKKHEEEVASLKYKISVEGYTDPQGTHQSGNKDFESYYNAFVKSPSFTDALTAHKTIFHSNMKKLMGPKGTKDPHNNNALSALRALAFMKLLLIEKAKSEDAERNDNLTTSYDALIAKYPELWVTVTAQRIKENDVPIKLIFYLDTVPNPVN